MNILDLYTSERERQQFEERWSQFLRSDCAHKGIMERKDNLLVYRTEEIIPKRQDPRTPLLFLLGNPASHSVASGMFFAFERAGAEHRFWKVLKKADLLSFASDAETMSTADVDMVERNRLRKNRLYELCYRSPFRVGLAVFYSMPSPASGYPWAGVAGLRRLFGERAFRKIGEHEKERIKNLVREFVTPRGTVIASQKDAYLGIKSFASPDYRLAAARKGNLAGYCQCDPHVRLFCCPPTRSASGALAALATFRQTILKKED